MAIATAKTLGKQRQKMTRIDHQRCLTDVVGYLLETLLESLILEQEKMEGPNKTERQGQTDRQTEAANGTARRYGAMTIDALS